MYTQPAHKIATHIYSTLKRKNPSIPPLTRNDSDIIFEFDPFGLVETFHTDLHLVKVKVSG